MGCQPIRRTLKKGQQEKSSKEKGLKVITVQLVNPFTSQIREIQYEVNSEKTEEVLLDLMNNLFFQDEKNKLIDVCFHSLYNKADDRFHYYLSRLMGVEMDNYEDPYLGRMWVLYINNKPYDWDVVVNTQMKFSYSNGGKLVWRFEKIFFSQNRQSVIHELSQTRNLAYLDVFRDQPNITQDFEEDCSSTAYRSFRLKTSGVHSQKSKSIITVEKGSLKEMLANNTVAMHKQLRLLKKGTSSDFIFRPATFSSANQNIRQFNGSGLLVMSTEEANIPPPLHTEAAEINDSKMFTFETQPNEINSSGQIPPQSKRQKETQRSTFEFKSLQGSHLFQ